MKKTITYFMTVLLTVTCLTFNNVNPLKADTIIPVTAASDIKNVSGTYQLQNNVDGAAYTFNGSADIVIDLNGYSLTGNTTSSMFTITSAKLTIKDTYEGEGRVGTVYPMKSALGSCFYANGGSTVVIENGVFDGSKINSGNAVSADGVCYRSASTSGGAPVLTINGGTFKNFKGNTNNSGAVITAILQGTINIDNATFENNSAGNGAAIQVGTTGSKRPITVLIKNSKFLNNTINGSVGGGAILARDAADITIDTCEFKTNKSTNTNTKGGAICVSATTIDNTKATIKNTKFENNESANGAACILATEASTYKTTLAIEKCDFITNTSNVAGSAVRIECDGATIKDSTFDGNVSKSSNGALWIASGKTTTVENCTFKNNEGNAAGGAAINANGKVIVKGATITDNTNKATGANSAGGIYGSLEVSGKVIIKNNKGNGNKTNNVYATTTSLTIGTDGLSKDSEIGITPSTNPTAAQETKVVSYDSDISGYFFADDSTNYYAKYNGSQVNLAVIPDYPSEISLDEDEITFTHDVTEPITLTATLVPSVSKYKTIEWETSNSGVATVANGVVSEVGTGTCKITAKVKINDTDYAKAECTVNVTNAPESISIDPTSAEVGVGFKQALNVTVLPNDADDTVTWKSSNTSIATVENGVVKGIGEGECVITAETTNGLKATCNVSVVYKHNHDDMKFIPWDSTTTLPTTSGYYHLTDNVTLSTACTINSTQNVVICLNGYTITSASNSRIFRLSKGANLTIYDCSEEKTGKLVPGTAKGGAVGLFTDDSSTLPVTFTMMSGTIDGTSITCTGNGGAIDVECGYATVNLNGGTIKNCTSTLSTAGGGGAVYVSSGNLNVGEFTFENNSTNKSGGAIRFQSTGDLKIDGATFKSNSATEGGAIWINNGIISVKNTTIEGNHASSTGGACVIQKDVTLENVTVKDNYATGTGVGGIFSSANVTLKGDVIIDNNKTSSTDGKNGTNSNLRIAVPVTISSLSDKSLVRVTHKDGNKDGTIIATSQKEEYKKYITGENDGLDTEYDSSNIVFKSHEHDGVKFDKIWTSATSLPNTAGNYVLTCDVVLNGSTQINTSINVNLDLNGHKITVNGKNRAYRLSNGANVAVYDCKEGVIIPGTAKGGFAALFTDTGDTVKPSFKMYGGTIDGTGKTVSDQGGAIDIECGGVTVLIDKVTFKNLTAPNGGAIYSATTGGTLTIKNSTFINNKSTTTGGAITTKNSTTISNCTFTSNNAANGGAIYSEAGASIVIEKSKFEKNTTSANGGALYSASGTITIDSDTIIGGSLENANTAANKGGAIYNNNATYTIDGTISYCSSSTQGGAIYTTGPVTLKGTISNCKSVTGGACLTDVVKNADGSIKNAGSFILDGGTITNCSTTGTGADDGGGAIAILANSSATIKSGNIVSNTSTNSYGGAICVKNNGSLYLQGGNITGNTSKNYSGAIHLPSALAKIYVSGNPVVKNNTCSTSNQGDNIGLADFGSNGQAVISKGTSAITSGAEIHIQAINSSDDLVIGEAYDTTDVSSYFVYDNSNYHVIQDGTSLKIIGHRHSGVDGSYTAWTSAASLPTKEGRYFLDTDISLKSMQSIVGDINVTLCLNGHTIDAKKDATGDIRVYRLSNGAKLTIEDCNEKPGKIIPGTSKGGFVGIYTDADKADADKETRFTFVNGIVDGTGITNANNGSCIDVANANAVVNINGGTIQNCTTNAAGTIYLSAGKLNINDGLFKGNKSKNGGSVVRLANATPTVEINGGEFDGNEVLSSDVSGTIFVSNTTHAEGEKSVIDVYGSIKITGGTFTNNIGHANGGSVINSNGDLELLGGTFTDNINTTNNVGSAVIYVSRNLTVGGKLIIKDNLSNYDTTSEKGDEKNLYISSTVIEDSTSPLETGSEIHFTHINPTLGVSIAQASSANDISSYFIYDQNAFETKWDNVNNLVTLSFVEVLHDGELYYKWTQKNALPTKTGKYVLYDDVSLTSTQAISSEQNIVLCLNNHTIEFDRNSKATAGRIYRLSNGVNLTIRNCEGETDGLIKTYVSSGGAIGIFNDAKSLENHDTKPVSLTIDNITFDGTDIVCTGNGGAITAQISNEVKSEGDEDPNKEAIDALAQQMQEIALQNRIAVTNSTFKNLTAGGGGAINVAQGILIVDGCQFINNKATTTAGSGGGAIFVTNGNASISNSLFLNNETACNGGAIRYNIKNTLTITNSVFEGNKCEATGGAIFCPNDSGKLELDNCSFVSNEAGSQGGALCIQADLLLKDTVVNNNKSTKPNTVTNEETGETTIQPNFSETGRSLTVNAGGIYYSKTITIEGVVECHDNYAYDAETETVTYPSNIRVISTSPILITDKGLKDGSNIDLTLNYLAPYYTVVKDGQEYAKYFKSTIGTKAPASKYTIGSKDGNITSMYTKSYDEHNHECGDSTTHKYWPWDEADLLPNESGYYYLVNNVTLTAMKQYASEDIDIHICLNHKNISQATDGQRLFRISGQAKLTVQDCTATRNEDGYDSGWLRDGKNNTGGGGAIYAAEKGTEFTLLSGGIAYCTTNESGGGILGYNEATINILGGQIAECSAKSNGGAIYCGGNSILNIKDGVITTCEAVCGGGVYVGAKAADADGNTFTDFKLGQMDGGSIRYCNSSECGGLYVSIGQFEMNGGEIRDNTAKNGAGVNVRGEGTFILNDGSITKNVSEASGAGIVAASKGKVIINGGEISYNNAKTGRAGGVYLSKETSGEMNGGKICYNTSESSGGISVGGPFTMKGGSISHNKSVKGEVGAIYIDGTTFNMYGGNVSYNTSPSNVGAMMVRGKGKFNMYGGRIYNNNVEGVCGAISVTSESTMNMYGGEIYDNTSKSSAGAIWENNNSTINMYGGKIHDNKSKNGGAMSVSGKFYMKGGEFYNNEATNEGGCIYVTNADAHMTMDGGNFHDNLSYNGGVLLVRGGAHVDINDGTFEKNSITGHGGVILCQSNGSATINGGQFIKNYADQTGAVFRTTTPCVLIINGGTYKENIAGGQGGVAYVQGITTINGGEFTDNEVNGASSTYQAAGGVILSGTKSITTINGGKFQGSYTPGSGAVVACWYNDLVTVNGGEFVNNRALTHGGVFFVTKADLDINGGTYTSNSSNTYGGIIYSDLKSNINIKNVDLLNSKASIGGAIYTTSGTSLNIQDSTIKKCNSAKEASALYCKGSVNLNNVTIEDNEAKEYGAVVIDLENTLEHVLTSKGLKISGDVIVEDNENGNVVLKEGSIMTCDNLSKGTMVYTQLPDKAKIKQYVFGEYSYDKQSDGSYLITYGSDSTSSNIPFIDYLEYLGLGVGAIGIVVVAIILIKKKKNKVTQ